MARLDVLIPTYNRPQELAVTLTSLYYQRFHDFRIVISDQSDAGDPLHSPAVVTALNLHRAKGRSISLHRHLPRRGMAEQRQYLLDQATAPYAVFLDDDLLLEPYVLDNLIAGAQKYQCGFVGQAPIGLSYVGDDRPHEQHIEFWGEKVEPESITPGDDNWQRYVLHNAANLYHMQEKLRVTPERPLAYKVAWIGSCILFDRRKLIESGGFQFWKTVPKDHVGEDVQAQLQVMRRFGGCGLIPSGVYHLESTTTIDDRRCNVPEYIVQRAMP